MMPNVTGGKPANKKNVIGPRLKAAMEARGIKQHELSKRSGVAQSMISHIVTGVRLTPGYDVLQKLELALGEPRIHLADPSDLLPAPAGLDEFLSSPLAADVTPEEAAFLRTVKWLPLGAHPTVFDWAMFVKVVRGVRKNGNR